MVLSYVPLLACAAVIGALAALGGAFRDLLWLLLVAVIGCGYLAVISRGQQLVYRGVRLTSKDQPDLMTAVDGVMKRAGIRRLDGVWLVGDPGAGALNGRRDWLGRRRLGVVVGLLTVLHLPADELAAVFAHEAGHLTDPRPVRLFLGRRRLGVVERLDRPVTRPMRWYWRWFLKVTREQALDAERHADAVAAQLCGADVAARALQRVTEASLVHELAMRQFVVRYWDEQISPATLLPAYEAVWTRMPELVAAGVEARMAAPGAPADTHPGLAERCGGRVFPLPPSLRGNVPLGGLEELDRRCTASLRQKERHYAMRTMTWDEIRAERKAQRAGPGTAQK